MPQQFQIPSPTWHDDPDIFDKILAKSFKDFKGRFLGIGAHFGNDWSLPLLDRGWTGVYCEPDPFACVELIKNTEKYQNQIRIVNSAVMDTSGLTTFYLSLNSSFLSSMRPDWMEKLLSIEYNKHWDLNPTQLPITTNAISFQELLDYIGTDFDLVVINAEGSDAAIIASINWKQLTNCKMICFEKEFVEFQKAGADIIKQLHDQGPFVMTDQTSCQYIYRRT
jgi:FkbM family methyltransferase